CAKSDDYWGWLWDYW
nr:immunoglobulin heavy chain junction region [Macaca mulatta]